MRQDRKEHSDFMSSKEDFERYVNERALWLEYPQVGDNVRQSKETIIKRIGLAMARKDRSNPLAYQHAVSSLRNGIATPEDYLNQLNMSWSEINKIH